MLNTDNSLLLIVDVQGNLALAMDNYQTLSANLQRLVKGALALELPIVWAEQLPEKLGETIQEVKELLSDYQPISKCTFSCGSNEEIMAAIRATGRKQVILTGIETHICVYQTAVELLEQGFDVEVIADAVGSRAPENRTIGLQKMVTAGASIGCTEGVLFELMRTAEHPAFRAIQQAVK